MRVITRKPLEEFWREHPDAEGPLSDWHTTAKRVAWRSIMEVRQSYPHADAVHVASGRRVTVFNMGGNKYRLVTAIHYNAGKVFVLRVMTHAQYDKDHWKDEL